MKNSLFFLLLSSLAFGQGAFVPPQQVLKIVNGITSPVPNATVTVCAASASGIPCAPALAGVLFKDAALTQPLPNPFTTDANGNYQFAIAPGTYTVTTTAAGFAGYSYQATIPSSGSTFTLPPASQASQALVSTGSGTTYTAQPYVSPAPNGNNYYIQKNCGSIPNCTQIFGDGQVVVDATTNSTNTITCPNNDCNFVAGDVGKSVWAVQRGGGASVFTGGTIICGNSVPVPTIQTVNSAQSITITGSACTASVTALAILVWGHKDGTTLHNMNPGCTTIYFPSNAVIIFDDSFLITPPACASSGLAAATGNPQPNLIGPNTSSTVWIASPDFNWADCTGTGAQSGVCVGAALSQIAYFTVWGTGPVSTSLTNCANANGHTFLAHAPAGGAMYFVNLSGICAGQSGLTGAELNSLDDQWNEGGVQNVGLTALVVSSKAVNTQSLDNYILAVGGNNTIGLSVLGTGQLNDFGSFLIACASITGTLFSHGTHFIAASGASLPCQAAVTVNNGGTHYSDGDFINQDTSTAAIGYALAVGGKGTIRNAKIGAPTGAQVAISNAGTLISQGGNVVTSGVVQSDFALMSGWDVLPGGCAGTAPASSTVILNFSGGGGPNSLCTSVLAATTGIVLPRPGTVVSLAVLAGTGGVNASSGVVTLLKNGVATASTCTLGTGTTCKDFTHQISYVAGDVLGVQFTTQAAETLANVRATVAAW